MGWFLKSQKNEKLEHISHFYLSQVTEVCCTPTADLAFL